MAGLATRLTIIMLSINFALSLAGYVDMPQLFSEFGVEMNSTTGVVTTTNNTTMSNVASGSSFESGAGTLYLTIGMVWDMIVFIGNFLFMPVVILNAVGAPGVITVMIGGGLTVLYGLSIVGLIWKQP